VQYRVLIIADDEWESALLKRVIVEAGYTVEIVGTAREGFARAQAWRPSCIVCDVTLPDIDGLWVARMVRLDPTPLSATPFVFLGSDEDKESRTQGFNVGADVFVAKPFRTEDVVGQIGALVAMAERMESRVSYGPVSSRAPPAMRGDIGQIDLSTVLTLLEMERRTGFLKVRTDSGETAGFEMLDGALERATLDGQTTEATAVLRKVFGWRHGRFWFRRAPVKRGTAAVTALGPLLLEAMRLIDEAAK
jgi:two-component system, OmpR family, response regulator